MSGVKGRTVTFTNQSQGKLGPSSILEWNFGDTIRGIPPITANDNDNPTHHYKHAGTYDVLLIVQDENRCRDSVLKRNHVVILGPRGSFSYYEESGNCKPLMVTFIPFVEEEPEYLPDSIQIHTGTGTMIVNRGDYYGVRRTGRTVYNEAGVYLPVCFLYKTVEFNGKKEFCLVQLNGEDTIYVIDLQPKFETEPLSGFDTINPTRFNNTSTWIPSYLHDSLVSVKWDMGNGDSSQNYNAETRYERTGKYAVELTMQVSNCIKVYTDTIVVTPQTGISTPDKAEKVKLYPNPSTGEINIEFADAKQRDIKLHNAHGRILHQKTYSEQKIQLFLEDLSTGTYYILIDNSTSVKFIIER
jgi:PKD repeat protein